MIYCVFEVKQAIKEVFPMIRMLLSEAEIADLKILRMNRKSAARERAHYVLLAHEGKSPPEIAQQLERNINTIRLWLHRYKQEGIAGLESRKQPGRPAVKAPFIEEHIGELLRKTPKHYGYQEAGWQINILRDWLLKQGYRVCENTILKALNKKNYVYKRFSKTTPKNAPTPTEKQAVVSEIVTKIKEEARESSEIFFVDEAHFSNQPYVNRGWFKKGEKKR